MDQYGNALGHYYLMDSQLVFLRLLIYMRNSMYMEAKTYNHLFILRSALTLVTYKSLHQIVCIDKNVV